MKKTVFNLCSRIGLFAFKLFNRSGLLCLFNRIGLFYSVKAELVRCNLKITDPIADLVYSERRVSSSYLELINLRRMLEVTASLDGDAAELGVFRRATAKLIAMSCPRRTVHLFDTFTGIPCKSNYDVLLVGHCKADINEVRCYLKDFPNVVFYNGHFPTTAKGLERPFAFVNLDADQYQVTLDGLTYFYPRLVKRGVIVLHDYLRRECPGVKQAVNDFGGNLICVQMWDSQAVIIKP